MRYLARYVECDEGARPGLASVERERLKSLEWKACEFGERATRWLALKEWDQPAGVRGATC